jgi:hypothetical protein
MMPVSKASGRRKYALTLFVFAGAVVVAFVLLIGASTDRGARFAMAGVGVLAILFGVFRPGWFLENDEPVPKRGAFDWLIVCLYIAAGIAAIIGAFTVSSG